MQAADWSLDLHKKPHTLTLEVYLGHSKFNNMFLQVGRGAQAATTQQSLEGGITELLSSTDTNKFTLNEKQACFLFTHCKNISLLIGAYAVEAESYKLFGP